MDVVFDPRLHLVEGFGFAAQSVHLRPSGDAGFDPMAGKITVNAKRVFLVVGDRMGPRPDQGHVAEHDVNELGQLIEAEASQNLAQSGHSWVALYGLRDILLRRSTVIHRSELVDGEFLVVEAVTGLAE